MARSLIRTGVVALVLAACTTTPPGTVSDVGAWTAGDPCPAVFFVGARGTDQPAGLGPQLDDAYAQFVSLLEAPAGVDVTVASHALDYPAARGGFGDSDAYRESVIDGARALPVVLDELVAACPAARLLIAGYSQGAQLITLADLGGLVAGIDAVLLLANPVFSPGDASTKRGDFDPERGGLFGQVDLDAGLAERTIQVCLDADPFCQAGSLGVFVHTFGYHGEALNEAVDWVAARVEAAL